MERSADQEMVYYSSQGKGACYATGVPHREASGPGRRWGVGWERGDTAGKSLVGFLREGRRKAGEQAEDWRGGVGGVIRAEGQWPERPMKDIVGGSVLGY